MLSFPWLYPGLRLKRWIFLIILSMIVLYVGFSGVMSQHTGGIHLRPPVIVELEDHLKHLKFVDFLFMLLAFWGIYLGIGRLFFSVLTVYAPAREKEFINIAYQRTRLKRGPRIVAVGGGTGLPNVLSSSELFYVEKYPQRVNANLTLD